MTISFGSIGSRQVPDGASGTKAGDAVGGGGVPGGAANAYIGSSMTQPNGLSTILKWGLGGAAGGAALGAGYGLLAGAVSFLPTVTVPMGAIIGGVAGGVLGVIKGISSARSQQTLAKDAQLQMQLLAQQQQQAQSQQPQGPTFTKGDSAKEVENTQRWLKKIGLYKGRVNGSMTDKTITAIKRYELMKGAQPTGTSSPELRTALNMDIKVLRQV